MWVKIVEILSSPRHRRVGKILSINLDHYPFFDSLRSVRFTGRSIVLKGFYYINAFGGALFLLFPILI
ncbi:MAG: hypothetical protein LBR79_04505 [Oscillospiraceae bacterium]|nr:hypothetical protein [Oscillospiraceae bacterium]